MSEQKQYTVTFNEVEGNALDECLATLRKIIVNQWPNPSEDGIFHSTCSIQAKLNKARFPDTKLTVVDYLKYADPD